MHDFTDELMGHVEWDRNRQVLVFARTVGDRRFVRMRVFTGTPRRAASTRLSGHFKSAKIAPESWA